MQSYWFLSSYTKRINCTTLHFSRFGTETLKLSVMGASTLSISNLNLLWNLTQWFSYFHILFCSIFTALIPSQLIFIIIHQRWICGDDMQLHTGKYPPSSLCTACLSCWMFAGLDWRWYLVGNKWDLWSIDVTPGVLDFYWADSVIMSSILYSIISGNSNYYTKYDI